MSFHGPFDIYKGCYPGREVICVYSTLPNAYKVGEKFILKPYIEDRCVIHSPRGAGFYHGDSGTWEFTDKFQEINIEEVL